MNQKVKLSKAISYVVVILAALLFLCIWPVGIFQQTYVSKSNELISRESDPVNVEHNVTQMFVAEGEELSAVDLYVCNDMGGETITFRLYDSSYKEIFNTFHVVKEGQEAPGFVHIPVGYDLTIDQEYFFTIEGLSADMTVAYEERETSTSIVNGYMSYSGIEIQRFNVVIRYEYRYPFAGWQVLLFGLGIAGVTVAILWGIKQLFEKKVTDIEVKVHTVFKVILNPLAILLGGGLCLMIFPGRVFGTGVINYAFLGGSTVLLTAIVLFLINFKRRGDAPLVNVDELKGKVPGYLQSFSIAMTLWYCCEYFNGLYNIDHSYSVRRMLVWFLIGIVCTYSKKELLKIWNLIYLVAASVYAYFYAKPYLELEQEGGLYKLDGYIIVIGGLVILLLVTNLIRLLLKKESLLKKLCVPYVLLFALLLGMMIAYRNMRDWIIIMTVIFALFYLRMWFWNKSDGILTVVGNGIMMNFIIMVCYSLIHRPFNRFRLYRYALGFHTVTVTGVYLSLVLSVALVWFLLKYQKTKRILDSWPQLLVLIIGNVYQILTLSRTGYLASFVMEVLIIIIFCFKTGKEKWKNMAKCFATITILTVAFCPVVFTVTRIMPSLWNDPFYFEVEIFGDQVFKGTPKDSFYYIDIEYYLERAGEKLLGIEKKNKWETSDNVTKDDMEALGAAMYAAVRKQLDPMSVFVVDDTILVASNEEGWGDFDSMSNGRIEIFKDYIAQWNLTGHESMSAESSLGGEHVHAHNVFLQVIHDHGLITGILFLLFGVISFVVAFVRYVKKKDFMDLLILSVIVAFAVSGLSEWNFHLCNPYGISLFMVLTPLLFKSRNVGQNE